MCYWVITNSSLKITTNLIHPASNTFWKMVSGLVYPQWQKQIKVSIQVFSNKDYNTTKSHGVSTCSWKLQGISHVWKAKWCFQISKALIVNPLQGSNRSWSRATGTPITGITWQASEKVQLVGCPLKCYLTLLNIIFNINIHFMLLFEIHGIPWIYKVPKNGHNFLPAPNPERSQASRPLPATCWCPQAWTSSNLRNLPQIFPAKLNEMALL